MWSKKEDKVPDMEFFTVYDSKSNTYFEPFPARNTQVVLRDFANAFKDPEAPKKNNYYRNAEDFSIFKIGSFDLSTGNLTVYNRTHVVNMLDIKAMCQPSASMVMTKENSPVALLPT